jgi:DNA (cytosine-5)-methyltransferase 1
MGHNTSHANGGGQLAIAFPGRMSATQCAATEDLAPSMCAVNPTAVAYTTKLHNTTSNNAGKLFEERTACLDANSPPPALLTATQVRRLTPTECERLQGFPDNFTQIPWRKKTAADCPDGPRYKALGNSWAVPVAAWIGARIDAVEAIHATQQKEAA